MANQVIFETPPRRGVIVGLGKIVEYPLRNKTMYGVEIEMANGDIAYKWSDSLHEIRSYGIDQSYIYEIRVEVDARGSEKIKFIKFDPVRTMAEEKEINRYKQIISHITYAAAYSKEIVASAYQSKAIKTKEEGIEMFKDFAFAAKEWMDNMFYSEKFGIDDIADIDPLDVDKEEVQRIVDEAKDDNDIEDKARKLLDNK